MGVPSSEVGYTSATNGRGDHEVPRGHVPSDMVRGAHHVSRHNTPIHNILSTAPQLSISQKTLGMLSEDGNVIPKH
jgi:hypothetical protein